MGTPSFGPEAWDPLVRALTAFVEGDEGAELRIYTDEGDIDTMSASLFFRAMDELREPDRQALARVRGRVLDVGAGVGAVSLILQDQGVSVTALEVIPEAVSIMMKRGVEVVREGRLEDLPPGDVFDTCLLLMNGSAVAGTLDGLASLLATLRGVMAPGGQVLMDSTDPLLGNGHAGGWDSGDYPGELQYQLEFRGRKGAPFPQLFVDPFTLAHVARKGGWTMEVVWKGTEREYLARLTRP